MLARLVSGQVSSRALRDLPPATTEYVAIVRVADFVDELRADMRAHNRTRQPRLAEHHLQRIVDRCVAITAELRYLLPALGASPRGPHYNRRAFARLTRLRAQITRISRSANDETARVMGVTRAGPGGRPDANAAAAIQDSLGSLGLSNQQQRYLADFVRAQNDEEKGPREALTAVFAQQQGLFGSLTSAKGRVATDVEYLTTDPNTPQLWDQKTMYSAQTPFDGRLSHTHHKAHDAQGRGVGLLIDSTYERPTNYESAWLMISKMLLSGDLPAEAIREVRAPRPELLRSEILVDLTRDPLDPNVAEARDVAWMERQRTGAQLDALEVIPQAAVLGRGLQGIIAGTARPHQRYTNNRDWLPDGIVYDEYAGNGFSNDGKVRFVVGWPPGAPARRVYLTVTHYKGFSVRDATGTQTRNPFYRVL